jgi:lysophospholipase L1-like esterase
VQFGGLGGIVVCYAFNGAGSAGTTTISAAPLGPTPYWCSLTSGSTMTVSTLGTSFANATAATAQPFTTILLGNGSGGVLGGLLGGVCLDPGTTCVGRGSTHSTAIAWTGDSITFGAAAAPSRPPTVLRNALPGRTVYNLGIGGSITSACVTRAQGAFASGTKTLVYLCGVNDLAADANGATTFAAAQVVLDQYRLAGRKVVPVLLTPWALAGAWTAGRQTQTDAFNAAMQAWCTTNSITCVSTASLGTGSPAQLQAGYDSGDGLHLNAAGATALAALVQAANP